jgi:hypothetical protein
MYPNSSESRGSFPFVENMHSDHALYFMCHHLLIQDGLLKLQDRLLSLLLNGANFLNQSLFKLFFMSRTFPLLLPMSVFLLLHNAAQNTTLTLQSGCGVQVSP